jgi:hypothetical protein
MKPLTKGQIEQALGRAALIEELRELEVRMPVAGEGIKELKAMEGSADLADKVAAGKHLEEVEQAFENFNRRRTEIMELLWHGTEETGPSWRQKIEALPREEIGLVVELILKRRPEVTPPPFISSDEFASAADDSEVVAEARRWAVEKIAELPEEERDTWTR